MNIHSLRKLLASGSLLILGGLALILTLTAPVQAQVPGSPPTPTAGPDGRIIYIVQSGDNCISIAARSGISVDQLRLNNNLQGDDCLYLNVGRELLIATVTPQPATPAPTDTPSGPTPTPGVTLGSVCVYLYADTNGNAMADDTELPLAGGAASLTDRLGTVQRSGQTDASGDPLCFDGIPEGDYNVSMGIPDAYNATTNLNYALTLNAGDTAVLDFGAQPSLAGAANTVEVESRSPILAILGGILLLGGVAVLAYRFINYGVRK